MYHYNLLRFKIAGLHDGRSFPHDYDRSQLSNKEFIIDGIYVLTGDVGRAV